MKTNMNKIFKFSSLIALVLVMILALSSCSLILGRSWSYGYGAEYDEEYYGEQTYVKYTYDEKSDTFTDGKTVYNRVELPKNCSIDCRDIARIMNRTNKFYYAEKSRTCNGFIFTTETTWDNSGILYANEEGIEYLNRLYSGKSNIFRMLDFDTNRVAKGDPAGFNSIINTENREPVKISDKTIDNSNTYTIAIYDDSDVVMSIVGTVYRTDVFDEMYYVPFESQTNVGYRLTNSEMSAIQNAINRLTYDDYDYTYQVPSEITEISSNVWDVMFGILYGILGVILPVGGIIFGLIELFGSKNRKEVHKVRNILLIVLCILWLVVGFSLLMMLLI